MKTPFNSMARFWAVPATLAFASVFPAALAQTLTVRSVTLVGSGQPEVQVTTSGPVSPATQAVTGPDRIVIDFPGAVPASTLQKLAVHRGALRGIRTGLFQSQPPITRVVLDVDGPTDYQVVPSGNTIVIKLGHPDGKALAQPQPTAAVHRAEPSIQLAVATSNGPQAALRVTRQPVRSIPALQVVNTVAIAPTVNAAVAEPPKPTLTVGVRSNLLSIRAEGATLAEVLYEVHRRTGADIAIPAGAEQERVVVNIPSAPGRDVIASLLNGSRFNYIVLGTDSDPGGFRNLLLSLKEGGGSSGTFVHNSQPSGTIAPPPSPAAVAPNADRVAGPADPAGLAQTGPELEPIPDDNTPPPAEPEGGAGALPPPAPEAGANAQPAVPSPIQNVPDPNSAPQ